MLDGAGLSLKVPRRTYTDHKPHAIGGRSITTVAVRNLLYRMGRKNCRRGTRGSFKASVSVWCWRLSLDQKNAQRSYVVLLNGTVCEARQLAFGAVQPEACVTKVSAVSRCMDSADSSFSAITQKPHWIRYIDSNAVFAGSTAVCGTWVLCKQNDQRHEPSQRSLSHASWAAADRSTMSGNCLKTGPGRPISSRNLGLFDL
ncbi:hypothetical protein VTK56DRAFT_1367 [Thermocarpiscus australiensis]